ncbi:ATP-binding protein [Novosphingobium sp. 1949]|uniref:histidine kinase n=1 Tax=Novosphingobium organovorum TaxID=2930092 RepID=A0ABT0BA56_9SPHN|nr:ATP-binding protein [Novosphingobium organovorum]MCJ2181922.1 ATP-binding protein [Novosphingobium organovorum]
MIRRRLFWKILLAFLCTYLAITQGLWLLITLTQDKDDVPAFFLRDETGPVLCAAAAQALHRGGLAELGAFEATLPEAQRRRLALLPARPAATAGWIKPAVPAQTGVIDRAVTDPQGVTRILRFSYPDTRPVRILNMPPIVLLLGFGAGLVFASLLAWYLTSPITHLRRGFEQLARGDLAIRLSPRIGKRRDEIADLSSDFDRMAAQVEQLVEARDRLLHDVSHELRSPLARIQLALALAERAPQRTGQALERVEHEVSRLDTLVGELLTLARAENDGSPGEDYFDLAGVTQSVVSDVRYEAQPEAVSIALSVSGTSHEASGQDRPLVRGNSELMRRAIENVLRNALRFSPRAGRIQVRVTRAERTASQPQALTIVIEDEGPGIPEAMVATMFQPFVRESNDGRSFGLGLAIASRAVRVHRGTIRASNRAQGGLRVEMEIPTESIAPER